MFPIKSNYLIGIGFYINIHMGMRMVFTVFSNLF